MLLEKKKFSRSRSLKKDDFKGWHGYQLILCSVFPIYLLFIYAAETKSGSNFAAQMFLAIFSCKANIIDKEF